MHTVLYLYRFTAPWASTVHVIVMYERFSENRIGRTPVRTFTGAKFQGIRKTPVQFFLENIVAPLNVWE